MARIIYGPLVTEIMGSIQGVTFQKNSSGSIIRSKPTLAHSSTIRQQESHMRHINALHSWQGLSNEQKDLWNTYASTYTKINKFGQTKKLTGQNWYEAQNYWIKYFNVGQVDEPLPHILPQAPWNFELFLTETKIFLNPLSDFNYGDNSILMFGSLPTFRSTTSINQIRKFCGLLNPPFDIPIDITSRWEAGTGLTWANASKYGNANIYICLQSISNGGLITSAYLCSKGNLQDNPVPPVFLQTDALDNLTADNDDQLITDQYTQPH